MVLIPIRRFLRESAKNTTILPLPDGCTPEQIQIESSICTGETTIGFYDAAEKKLRYAELVKTPADIAAFYARYGLTPPDHS